MAASDTVLHGEEVRTILRGHRRSVPSCAATEGPYRLARPQKVRTILRGRRRCVPSDDYDNTIDYTI